MAEIIQTTRGTDSGSSSGITQVQIINQSIFISNEVPVAAALVNRRTFTTNYTYVVNTLRVCLNGMRQRQGVDYDYEEMGGNQFRFTYALDPEDEVIVDYITIMQVPGSS